MPKKDISAPNFFIFVFKDKRRFSLQGFILREFPTKPELKYTRFDGAEKIVKLTKCKQKITKEKKKECYEAFEIFMKGEDDRIRDEVGKLVAISGATLSQREEQLYILRQTFANKNN